MTYPAVNGSSILDSNDVLMVVDYLNNHPQVTATESTPAPAVTAPDDAATVGSVLGGSTQIAGAAIVAVVPAPVEDAMVVPASAPDSLPAVTPAVTAATTVVAGLPVGSAAGANATASSTASSAALDTSSGSGGSSTSASSTSGGANTTLATAVDLLLGDDEQDWLDA